MNKSSYLGEIQERIEKKLCKENEVKPPIDLGFSPPRNIKLDLFHAIEDNKVAHIDLITTKIQQPSHTRGMAWDWVQLYKKKAELQELFIFANKAVRENKASISRFREIIREKAIDERFLRIETQNIECEIEQYKETYEKMKKYVSEYSVYERFLASVAQDAPEFNSVGDILNRYETLELTRNECSRILEFELEGASDMRKAMVTLVDEKSSQLKNLSNKLVMLQVNKKQAKVRRMYWEHMLQRMKNAITNKEEENLALIGACWDLYRQLCSRRGLQPTLRQEDLDGQLDFIRKTIIFYKEVATIAGAKHAQNSGTELKTTE